MYSLIEYWKRGNMPFPKGDWDGNIICTETDSEITFGTNNTHGFLLCYSFTIVMRGWLVLLYNNREIQLREGDLYAYSPGLEVTVLSASDDYRGICLLADEHFTLGLPLVHDAIHAAYFAIVELTSPVLSLKTEDLHRLQELMLMMLRYQQTELSHVNDCLRLLYNLFLTDLSAIQQRNISEHRFSKRVEDIFLGFLELLPKHFIEHHDIRFYASELCITTTYLSRVVRMVSGGRTVVYYINQLLLMEAMFLLRQTKLNVAQIADRLHFSETTTFARFFNRMKGMTPNKYRIVREPLNC